MGADGEKYLENATINGLKYTTKKFHIIERIFWVCALISSGVFASILIAQLVIKIKSTPVVVYRSEHQVSAKKINYPAITVCHDLISSILFTFKPGTSGPYTYGYFKRHSLEYKFFENEEFIEKFMNDQAKFDAKIYEHINNNLTRKYAVTHPYYNKIIHDIYKKIQSGQIQPEELGIHTLKHLQVIDLITRAGLFQEKNISIPTDDFLDVINSFHKLNFEDILFEISWSTYYKFGFFSEILAELGLCSTINIAHSAKVLNIDKISDDFHYQIVTAIDEHKSINQTRIKIPRKFSTPKEGLDIQLPISGEYDFVGSDYEDPMLIIHDPYELPLMSSSLRIPFNRHQKLTLTVEPQVNRIDPSLYDENPFERNCYREGEKRLEFFKVYTKTNCEHECLAEFMVKKCNCVEFYIIRNKTTRICAANKKTCFDKARNDFEQQKEACKCLLPCDYVQYDINVDYKIIQRMILDPSRGFYTNAQIRFADIVCNEYIRKKQFDFLDFLSYVGGVLGLFAGVSILSLVEIIFWFTIRIITNVLSGSSSRVHPFVEDDREKKDILHFFKSSSIHGFNYFHGKNFIQIIFWVIAIVFSMTMCIFMIADVKEKLPKSRTVAYDDSSKFIENIPFPAFTFEPDVFRDWDYVDNYFFYFNDEKFEAIENNATYREEILKRATKDQACFYDYVVKFRRRSEPRRTMSFNLRDRAIKHLRDDSEIHWFQKQFASWNGKFSPKFSEVRTIRGMAFSFNLMDAEKLLNFDEIDEEFNYTRNVSLNHDGKLLEVPESSYPIKMNSNDRFELVFKFDSHEPPPRFLQCIFASFFVHSADFLPMFAMQASYHEFQRPGTTLTVEVTPEITRTDDNLRKLKPHERECYFDGEKKLKIFKIYSKDNCKADCLTNQIINACNCSNIDLPYNEKKGIPICNETDCIFIIVRRFNEVSKYSAEEMCSCLPTCNSISYKIKHFPEYHKIGESNETIIKLRMNMDDIVLLRRFQQISSSDVVSYVGGILGLFAGISMLSIVEIFYFFTLRVLSNIVKLVKRN